MNNPTKDKKGSSRVKRGGDWGDAPYAMRASYRSGSSPAYRFFFIGFRLVRNKA
jgi:formylglycine-generating enzyme required for sulfatase activity